jgi:hypothetical protein
MEGITETVRLRRRWYLWLLAMVVVYLAGAISVWLYSVKRPPSEYDRAVTALYQEIRVGDSVERLQSSLGPGRDLSPTERATFESLAKSNLKANHLPDGYETSDRLLVYEFQNEVHRPFSLTGRHATFRLTTYFQFRDGRLVNHDPRDYQGLQPRSVSTLW